MSNPFSWELKKSLDFKKVPGVDLLFQILLKDITMSFVFDNLGLKSGLGASIRLDF